MSGSPNLAEVAQDYCELHVNVEARNPNEHSAPGSFGARLMKKLSTGVDFGRILSLGGKVSEDEKDLKKDAVNGGLRGEGSLLRFNDTNSEKGFGLVKKLSRSSKKLTGFGKPTAEKLLLDSSPLSQRSSGFQETREGDQQMCGTFFNRKRSSVIEQTSEESHKSKLLKKKSSPSDRKKFFH